MLEATRLERGWWRLRLAWLRLTDYPPRTDHPAILPAEDGDLRFRVDYTRIGARASHFLLVDPADFVRRNVETIEIKSASFGRRRLTIDIQLPSDPALAGERLAVSAQGGAGEAAAPGPLLFWVPITSIAKHPPRSNIDLRDGAGNVVALLTRAENAAITLAAIEGAAASLMDQPPEELPDIFSELLARDGLRASATFVHAREVLEEAGVDLDRGEGLALISVLETLAANSLIWVPLIGEPGERRVIKFHYDIEFKRPPLRRQKPDELHYLLYYERTGVIVRLDVPVQGDEFAGIFPRRLLARIATTAGLAPFDLAIQSPYMRGSSAYHLQVSSPPAVETRDIYSLAELDPETRVETDRHSHGVHLYLSDSRLEKGGRAGQVIVPLRVGRRGFMTLCWITTVLIAAALWLFFAAHDLADDEASAAVLLVGPALLTAFVVRPGEHPVATRLLSGVRLLVSLAGILSLAAAAAIGGAKPRHWSVHHSWYVYSLIASGIAAAVTFSWLLSWDSTEAVGRYLRFIWGSAVVYLVSTLLLALALGAVLVLHLDEGALGTALPRALPLAALLVIAAPAIFAVVSYPKLGLPADKAPGTLLALWLSSLAALAGAGTLTMGICSQWAWHLTWILALLGVCAAILLLAVQGLYLLCTL